MTLKKTIEQHKYTILFCLILIFGALLRLVQLGKVPGGYQMDEAYGAFNAYSLFHSGIDSTGHSYPVYFESWGGGQNALNSYLMLPFMLFTGGRITPLVVRLPQVIVAFPLLAFLLVNRGILPEFSIGPFSIYAMTDFRVNEIASSFQEIFSNFRNLLYLLYRQDIGRPYDVIMPFGFFGKLARVFIFLGVFLLVFRLIRALWKRQTILLWMIFIQLTGALLLGLLISAGMTQINCIYIPLVMCGALCVSSATDFIGKKTGLRWKTVISILLTALLLIENVQFEKA